MEKKIRSIVKSIVWRILATVNGFIVAYLFLSNINQSLKISIIANISGLILYYIHERIWNKIDWQRELK
jgi:uncharacterized membrane protein